MSCVFYKFNFHSFRKCRQNEKKTREGPRRDLRGREAEVVLQAEGDREAREADGALDEVDREDRDVPRVPPTLAPTSLFPRFSSI